jgi:lipoprotein-anchoring transpeptidase ErfK/SrfK
MGRFRYRLVAVLFALALFFTFVPTVHAAGGRSIDVNLSTQTATAYEGDTAVYSAGVTSGRPGFETPTGTFSIVNRVADETMDSSTIGIPRDSPGGYYLTGILYTQYFDNIGDALHYNYWSPASAFGGYPTSHGCVGMQLDAAAFFWDFADIGTPVTIHY